jgi:uncharacterized membrane protein
MADAVERPAGTALRSGRLFSLDALRGLIMVLMALDHANHFVAQKHPSGEYWGGPFPAYHGTLPFLTRLVTHLAAPGFFFLMGAGMLLFARSRRKENWSEGEIIRHLALRGGVLIALQLLIVNRAWELSPGGWGLEVYIGVLFALGGAMILASPLLRLRPTILLVLAAVLVLGTELLTPSPDRWNQGFPTLGRLLLIPGGSPEFWVNYPVLPWLELVVLGMVFGHWLAEDSRKAYSQALGLGGAFILVFLALRALDGFGNLRPRAGTTWIDWLDVVKYPPSITFTLLTTGVNLTLLGMLGRAGERTRRLLHPLVVFGRVPLFFYVTHLFLYAGLGRWLAPAGMGIPSMYPYWVLGLIGLYLPCWGYGTLKHRQPSNSVLHFF